MQIRFSILRMAGYGRGGGGVPNKILSIVLYKPDIYLSKVDDKPFIHVEPCKDYVIWMWWRL